VGVELSTKYLRITRDRMSMKSRGLESNDRMSMKSRGMKSNDRISMKSNGTESIDRMNMKTCGLESNDRISMKTREMESSDRMSMKSFGIEISDIISRKTRGMESNDRMSKAGTSAGSNQVTSAGSEVGTSAGSEPGMGGNVMECGRDGQETGKCVTDVFGENALKKKEEIFVEFEVVTEDTEDLLSLEGRKFIDKKSMNDSRIGEYPAKFKYRQFVVGRKNVTEGGRKFACRKKEEERS
jgi:hypothetical protein